MRDDKSGKEKIQVWQRRHWREGVGVWKRMEGRGEKVESGANCQETECEPGDRLRWLRVEGGPNQSVDAELCWFAQTVDVAEEMIRPGELIRVKVGTGRVIRVSRCAETMAACCSGRAGERAG